MNTASPAPAAAPTTMEKLISNLLRGGIYVSLSMVVLGALVSVARHPGEFSKHEGMWQIDPAHARFPTTISQTLSGVAGGEGRAIIVLGLMLLILTPVVRVAASAAAFALEKDRTYTIITLIVLTLLLLSFFLGKVEK